MTETDSPAGFDYGAKRPDGQHERHPSLPPEARREFVRPVRRTYRHVGFRPTYPTRPLTAEERERFGSDWACYEEYPPGCGSAVGRFWTREELDSGCGAETTMALNLAETYAAQPGFYGSTFCSRCGGYFLVREFVWVMADGSAPRVGS